MKKIKFIRLPFVKRVCEDIANAEASIGHVVRRCVECHEPLIMAEEVKTGYCDNCCQTLDKDV